MKLWIGTSGFSYPEWKGPFYPDDLPAKKMFAYYAERFSTVEINATFFRMPTEELIAGWSAGAPAGFRYSLKAPKLFTFTRRLRGCDEPLALFFERVRPLGERAGAILFHLPPYVEKDVGALRDFCALLPRDARCAFDFRSATWEDDSVYSVLSDAKCALCISDSEDRGTPLVATATWGYLRLRDEGYKTAELERWHRNVTSQKWDEAYVYFKHEDTGRGPGLAVRMKEIAAGA